MRAKKIDFLIGVERHTMRKNTHPHTGVRSWLVREELTGDGGGDERGV